MEQSALAGCTRIMLKMKLWWNEGSIRGASQLSDAPLATNLPPTYTNLPPTYHQLSAARACPNDRMCRGTIALTYNFLVIVI